MMLFGLWGLVWPSLFPAAGGQWSVARSMSDFIPKERTAITQVVDAAMQRTPGAHIGSVMAILATFDEAGVLPAEHDPEANQLIHTVIQLQSVVLKSQSPAIGEWVLRALQVKSGDSAGRLQEDLSRTGLTMESLEAFVDYGERFSPWDRAELVDGFHEYNVRQEHWSLLRKILVTARGQLRARGETLAKVFARQRVKMPGAAR